MMVRFTDGLVRALRPWSVRTILATVVAMALLALLAAGRDGAPPQRDLRRSTFQRLEDIRQEKKAIILSHFGMLMDKAGGAAEDAVLRRWFQTLGQSPSRARAEDSPPTLDMDTHYVQAYGEFHDILFVKPDGFIFHTIKMESDYHASLFEEPLASTRLARALREEDARRPGDVHVVDYDYYHPSREAAAFFVVPVAQDGTFAGWILLQFSINTINTVLADHDSLGRTGEVYLANTEKLMLSQSRLVPEDTVLKLRVDTLAPEVALEKTSGNMIISDYRGVPVFSSFEKFSVAGNVWIIIAEIDEDEVLTDYLLAHGDDLLPRLLAKVTAGAVSKTESDEDGIRVDINEYHRAQPGQSLRTHGLATCTGVTIAKPGRFAYLGHIYPLDRAYRSGLDATLTDLGLTLSGVRPSGSRGDLFSGMIRAIKRHEVVPAELTTLEVVVVAVHADGLKTMVRELLEAGLFVSRIRVLLDPTARYANVSVRALDGSVAVEWVSADGHSRWTSNRGGPTLGDLVRELG